MKRNVFLIIGLCICVSYGTLRAQKNQLSQYSILKKNNKKSTTLRSLGLEKITDDSKKNKSGKSNISDSWITNGDTILIDAVATDGNVQALMQELQLLGIERAKIYNNIIYGYMPVNTIPSLDSCKYLVNATPEFKPKTNVGSVTSEGVQSMLSGDASERFGVNGKGIKIGILSDSYNVLDGANSGVLSGDLPGTENPNGFTTEVTVLSEIVNTGIGSDEGRAMAELIHDVAPGAELFFYSAFNGFFDYADGIRALNAAGCDIIVDDILYFTSPYFQEGAIAQAVNDVNDQGTSYFSAAFNLNFASFENKYESITVDTEDGPVDFVDFGDGDTTQTVFLNQGDTFRIFFQWDDPSLLANSADFTNPNPDTDLDILLFNANGDQELVAVANADNIINGENLEVLEFTNNTTSGEFALSIFKFAGPDPRRIKYVSSASGTIFDLFFSEPAPSTFGHANSRGAVTVGANNFLNTPEFGSDFQIRGFSSRGGTPILIDAFGNDIAPIIRQKPDVVGPDGTNTTFFGFDSDGDGFGNFSGTSAAAPHVAAVAALLLEKDASLTPDQIRTILQTTAVDMDDPETSEFDTGFDFATGFGFVQADRALASIDERPVVYRYELINSSTNEVIRTLRNEDEIDLATIAGASINIRALATKSESVRLELFGRDNTRTIENVSPYALFGDNDGDYNDWDAPKGSYFLTGKGFTQDNAGGNSSFPPSFLRFSVTNSAVVSSYDLVDVTTGTIVAPLTEELNFDTMDEIVKGNLNIKANVSSINTDSPQAEQVKINLYGSNTAFSDDSSAPFTLFNDADGNSIPWAPLPISGDYTLEAQAFARAGDRDSSGDRMQFTFNVINNETADNKAPLTIKEGEILNIYPNPSSDGQIYLSGDVMKGIKLISVYDIFGKKIFSKTNNSEKINQINLSGYPKGMYLLKVMDKDATSYQEKILLN